MGLTPSRPLTLIQSNTTRVEPTDNIDTRKLHNVNKEMETVNTQESSSSTTPDPANQPSTGNSTTERLSTATATTSDKKKKRTHEDMEDEEVDKSEDVGSTSSFSLSVAGNNTCPSIEEMATRRHYQENEEKQLTR